jgi:hypothetical protein
VKDGGAKVARWAELLVGANRVLTHRALLESAGLGVVWSGGRARDLPRAGIVLYRLSVLRVQLAAQALAPDLLGLHRFIQVGRAIPELLALLGRAPQHGD